VNRRERACNKTRENGEPDFRPIMSVATRDLEVHHQAGQFRAPEAATAQLPTAAD